MKIRLGLSFTLNLILMFFLAVSLYQPSASQPTIDSPRGKALLVFAEKPEPNLKAPMPSEFESVSSSAPVEITGDLMATDSFQPFALFEAKVWTVETSPLTSGPKSPVCMKTSDHDERPTCFDSTQPVIEAYLAWKQTCDTEKHAFRDIGKLTSSDDLFGPCAQAKQTINQAFTIQRFLEENPASSTNPETLRQALRAFESADNLPLDLKKEKVIALNERLVELVPQDVGVALSYLGNLFDDPVPAGEYMRQAHEEKSERALAALEADPNLAAAHLEYKFKFETRGMNETQLRQVAEQFASQHPGTGISYYHAARQAYTAGDNQASIDWLNKALAIEPANSRFKDALLAINYNQPISTAFYGPSNRLSLPFLPPSSSPVE